MKNFILASSIAALAAGNTTPSVKSMPATKTVKHIRKMVNAERKAIRTAAKTDAKAAKASKLAAQTVAKEEGLVFSETHSYSDFFEISQGLADCSTTVGRVEGWETGRCIDYVLDDNGMGETESQMIMKPNNGGFPIWYFFTGHGCREENMDGHWRMPKTEFGFFPTYTPADGCVPMFDGPTATSPSYYQGAMWSYMRHEPSYPSVMQGIDGKDKGCRRNKYAEYEVLAAFVCQATHAEDSTTPEYTMFDITSCTSGSVEEKTFSDPSCTAANMIKSETYNKEECVFDFHEFKMYLEEDGDAAFEYRSRDCTWGTAT